ncbi:multidrug transporter MatE [Euzebyella marina]|uniref:Multidrug transporter MatE n=1 Tax=Euzebyella marina TaxID=1761453 RepID=A0A3G2L8D6_9FLAO|nr:polysaccharide biosynthesis C-terminal domain-containing protein [Euzebyella marina]AYN68441.1 multidrug transporter MatE [Euzebyella marina]
MRSFISDLIRVGISKVLMILFGLATSIITARFLGPENNGVIATLMVYPSLFMSIGSLGIRQSTAYFLGKKLFEEERIKTAITQIWFFTSILSVLICFILIRYLSKAGDNLFLILLALIPVPFSLFATYNSGIFLGKNEIGTFNKINWVPTLILLLLTTLLVIFLELGIAGYLIAMIGGPLFISLFLLFKNDFLKSFSSRFEWSVIKQMLGLGLIYAFSLLIINLNYKVDIILLDSLSNAFETGIYSKGSAITQYLWQIPMLLSTIVFARSAVSKNDEKFSLKITQLLRLSLIAIGLGSIVLFCFSELLIVSLFGVEFEKSISVLNLLLPGVLLLTFFKVMNMDLAGKGKPWVALKAMAPALVLNVVLNILLIPDYGANGASIASTISYSVAALLFLHFYSKEVNISIKVILSYKKSDFSPILKLIKR